MAHTLSVERLVSTYLVPQDHPAPDQVRRELDEVARKFMADCWGRALSELLDPGDPSVWLIDRVAVDFLMDIGTAEPETVAAIWAGKMAESVVKTIAQGGDGERVMRFANRAEFLAYFLLDVAGGAAWKKWYYRQFETLRSLPASAAIREALLRESDQAEPALLHLAKTGRINQVAGSLSQFDRETLLQLCCPDERTPGRRVFEFVLEAWSAEPSRTRHPLTLYLKARSKHPEGPAAEVRGAVGHAFTIGRWHQDSRFDGIISAIAAGRLTEVVERLTPAEQQTLLYLAFLWNEDSASPARLVEMIRGAAPVHASERTARTAERNGLCFATQWAGVFMFLSPLIANRELMRAYGGVEDGVLRYLLLGHCLRRSSTDPQFDLTVAIAAGLQEPPDRQPVQQARPSAELLLRDQDLLPEDVAYASGVDANQWPDVPLEEYARSQIRLAGTVLLRNFARTLPGLGQSSSDYLWRNVLSGDGVITSTPGQIVVVLAPRPLEIVLRLAGFNEMRFTPPWLAETEVVIRIDGQ